MGGVDQSVVVVVSPRAGRRPDVDTVCDGGTCASATAPAVPFLVARVKGTANAAATATIGDAAIAVVFAGEDDDRR